MHDSNVFFMLEFFFASQKIVKTPKAEYFFEHITGGYDLKKEPKKTILLTTWIAKLQ